MTFLSRLLSLLAAFSLVLAATGAHAQGAGGEPTVAQIYQAASTGQLERANAMVDQVLKSHPNSGKAHYVKAELSARERKWDLAREELAKAEKLAPGLPFAKPESVQALRNQLANATQAPANSAAKSSGFSAAPAPAPARVRQERSFPWGTLAIVALIVAGGVMLLRRRPIAPPASAGYGGAYGNTSAAPYGQTGYGPFPPPDGGVPPAYPQQPSMGSTIARGVGTGLAVGAGVVAAEAIGRHMFGRDANAAPLQQPHEPGNTPTLDQIDEGMRRNLNTDMGGNDFGVADGGWDDGGGGDFGGDGGGWDS